MKISILIKFLLLSILITTSGCSSVSTRMRYHNEIRDAVNAQNFSKAIQLLESNKTRMYDAKDRVLYYLDLGLLYHYDRQFSKSNELLTQAEYAIEDLYTRSISRAAASMLLNDNVLEYPGEDYEDIYINVIKALNFLKLNQFDSAFVEIRRINEKLVFLEDKYKALADEYNRAEEAEIEIRATENKFHNSALGRYLSMIIYLAEGDLDAARIDYNYIQKAFQDQANIYDFPKPDLTGFQNSSRNQGLNVISFTGKAPYKKAFERRITTFKDHIVVSGNQPYEFIDTIYWPGIDKDFHFKLSLPFMQRRNSEIERTDIFVDGRKVGSLSLIEDVGNVAVETFSTKQPLIYLRAVTRTVVKGLIAERAKAEMAKKTGSLGGLLLRVATDVAVDLSENADLRTSRYLPGRVSVANIDLPPGNYEIEIRYFNRYGNLVYADRHDNFTIDSNNLNLIHSFYLN